MTGSREVEAISLGRQLSLIARRWRQNLDARLRPFGVTDATWQPLLELKRHNGPMRQKEIAGALQLDKSSVVRTLRMLEKKGLIIRYPDEHDKRSHYIAMTEAGHNCTRDILRIAAELEQEILEFLGPESTALTYEIAQKIFQSVERAGQYLTGPDHT